MQATKELRYTGEREKSTKKGFWAAIISAVSFSTLGILQSFYTQKVFRCFPPLRGDLLSQQFFLWLILLLHAQRDRKQTIEAAMQPAPLSLIAR